MAMYGHWVEPELINVQWNPLFHTYSLKCRLCEYADQKFNGRSHTHVYTKMYKSAPIYGYLDILYSGHHAYEVPIVASYTKTRSYSGYFDDLNGGD